MINLGVNVAVIDDGRVLLTQREDFEVWCLPGGGVDPGESLAQAAIREVREETGLEVELHRFVGMYSRPLWMGRGYHIAVFAATRAGGVVQPQPGEVIAVQYFDPGDLPLLLWGQRQRIEDAVAGLVGVVRVQEIDPRLPQMTRDEIYAMRDQSGLPPVEFYTQHVEQYGPEDQRIEVPGMPRPEH
jgi:ADP-ribose pyrophosphatase YjhB (NUDIX family)